jgi:hypothetical protein
MYISVNRHFINYNNCSAVYLHFARERVKRRFPISNVSAGNTTLCREQHVNCWLITTALENNPTVRNDETVLTNTVTQPIRDALRVTSDKKRRRNIDIFLVYMLEVKGYRYRQDQKTSRCTVSHCIFRA